MILWALGRASGLTALGVYTVVITWGILLSGRALRPAAPQAGMHRLLGSIGLGALAVHVTTLALDPFAAIAPWTLIGVDQRLGIVAGAAALWLLVLLPITFRLRRSGRLSPQRWRRLHYLGYAAWLLAIVHGLAVGSSTGAVWATAAYAAAAGLVAGAAWWRWVAARPRAVRAGRAPRTPA